MSDPRRPSRLRLSLRALMVIVLVTGVLIAWRVNRANDQRRVVAAIKAANGRFIAYDFQFAGDELLNSTPLKPNKEPAGPKWLRNAIGDEYFQDVTMAIIPAPVSADILPSLAKLDRLVFLSLNVSRVDDSSLARLAELSRLQKVVLTNASVGDAALANLARARGLVVLALHGAAGVTDAGMTHLAGLPDLKSLAIYGAPKLTAQGLKNLGPRLVDLESLILFETAITDEGLACLEACRKLKILSLSGVKIGDAGFAHFAKLESLENLVASRTGVTDEGLAAIRGLRNLRSLSLGQNEVSDPGLAYLEPLVRLESLILQETKITDNGLGSIRKLKGLKSLILLGTEVSPQGVAGLLLERPSLRIVSGPTNLFRRIGPGPAAPPTRK